MSQIKGLSDEEANAILKSPDPSTKVSKSCYKFIIIFLITVK